MILTLADKAIVSGDGTGYELDETEEVLENVNMARHQESNSGPLPASFTTRPPVHQGCGP